MSLAAAVLFLIAISLLVASEVHKRWWWWRRVREVERRPPLDPPEGEIERDRAERARRSWTHRWVHRGGL